MKFILCILRRVRIALSWEIRSDSKVIFDTRFVDRAFLASIMAYLWSLYIIITWLIASLFVNTVPWLLYFMAALVAVVATIKLSGQLEGDINAYTVQKRWFANLNENTKIYTLIFSYAFTFLSLVILACAFYFCVTT